MSQDVDLTVFTNEQQKKWLKDKGLPAKGAKAELIQRIRETVRDAQQKRTPVDTGDGKRVI